MENPTTKHFEQIMLDDGESLAKASSRVARSRIHGCRIAERTIIVAATSVSFCTAPAIDAAVVPVTSELQISDVDVSTGNVAIARDAVGDFVVAWIAPLDRGSTINTVYLRRYDAQGTPISTAVPVAGADCAASVALAMDADGDFVVAWPAACASSKSWNVEAQSYNADGTQNGSMIDVGSQSRSISVSVAMDDQGDYAVAWTNNKIVFAAFYFILEHGSVYVRAYGADGTAKTKAIEVDKSSSHLTGYGNIQAAVAMNASGDFTVAWNHTVNNSGSVLARRFNQNGQFSDPVQWVEHVHGAGTQFQFRAPSIGMDSSGDAVIAWGSEFESELRFYGASGSPVTPAFYPPIDGAGFNPLASAAVAMNNDGTALMSWAVGSYDITRPINLLYQNAGQYYAVDGTPIDAPFAIGSNAMGAVSTALDASGALAAAWIDPNGAIEAQLFSAP